MPTFISPKGNREKWVNKPEGYYTEEEHRCAFPEKYQPSIYHKWNGCLWVENSEERYDEAAKQVRHKRNALLKDCDHTVCPDYPRPSGWIHYRQELRDISSQSGFPFNVEWPQKPE